MATESPVPAATASDWRKLHALGLPAGSVRALLAILIFGTAWAMMVLDPTVAIPPSLRDLLFIVMGYYFASRRRVRVEPDELPGPPPLYLPRGTIRVILIGGTLAVAVVLHQRGALTRPEQHRGVMTLWLVGGFLLGVALHSLGQWWISRGHRLSRTIEDTRAILAIVATLGLAALLLNRPLAVISPPYVLENSMAAFLKSLLGLNISPDQLLAAVVGFYFGSRS